jgi:hypothetical protein
MNQQEKRENWEFLVLAIALLLLLILAPNLSRGQYSCDPDKKVTIIGGMSMLRGKDPMRKGQHLVFQNAIAGVNLNTKGRLSPVLMVSYGQYPDSNYTAPRNTLGAEIGLFYALDWITPGIEFGENRAGMFVKPSLKIGRGKFKLDLYYQQKMFAAGFFVYFIR